jgi:restriction endonuclease Mrr
MTKQIPFEVKEKIIALTGACFWYWNGFYSFLDECGVSKTFIERYPKEVFNKRSLMRNILKDLEERGEVEVIQSIISNFYRLKGPIDKDKLDSKKAKDMLAEFRELVGNDPIEKALLEKERERLKKIREENILRSKSFEDQLNELLTIFQKLSAQEGVSVQKRGFELEKLFFRLLEVCEFEFNKPFRTDSEQIDGHFKFEKFDYLVEVKWEKEPTKQKDLSIFDGKIRGKAQSTRGFFLSAAGFDEKAVDKFSGDAPRIILMTGEDLVYILLGRISFFDVLKAKTDAIVRRGQINFSVKNILL